MSKKDFTDDLIEIVESARKFTFHTANLAHVASCFLIGRRIFLEEQEGKERADYGKYIIEQASKKLTQKFGSGYSKTNIKNFRSFYTMFSDYSIGQTMLDQLQIGQTMSDQLQNKETKLLPDNLSWSHYERLIRIDDENARTWYMQEASKCQWDFRTLKRNIDSQYYYRLMKTPDNKKNLVQTEMESLTKEYQNNKLEYIKNPVLVEFLGFKRDEAFSETNLENAIITHLKNFILEMGKGYAFVARQQHIKTDMGDYYIDLVFYNYILKCFLLVDLKTEQITHQDVGQMEPQAAEAAFYIISLQIQTPKVADMYVRMYDELKCSKDDNPTIGLVLCAETSSDLARFSILKDKDQIFAAKYLTYLPTKEQLKKEIETQKTLLEITEDRDGNDSDHKR